MGNQMNSRTALFVLMGALAIAVPAALWLALELRGKPAPVERGPHAHIADIWLPRGSTYDLHSNDTLEMWHANASLAASTSALNALLPVNRPLGGLPYCGSAQSAASGGTYWAWGTPADVVRVGVAEIDVPVMITIERSAPQSGTCSPLH